MTDPRAGPRLFLVTPPDADPGSFPGVLAEALAAADVAAVLIASEAGSHHLEALAESLVPIVQATGAAALIENDTRLAGRVKADGVHVSSGLSELRLAAGSLRPKRIVGAGNLASRHAAMQAGELGVDYVFFGRPHGDTHDAPHPKSLELAAWWAELMEIPAVIMAGRSLDGLLEAAAAKTEFVALNRAVWEHAAGPADAIRLAAAALAPPKRRVA